jgi:hypothetical protein
MKKMNVYEAPKAEVIEMNLNATVLTGSITGEVCGQNIVPGNK